MKEIVKFFWIKWKHAYFRDLANPHSKTRKWHEADQWIQDYKRTLSKNKQSQFDKIFQTFQDYYQQWQNAAPKKQDNMKNPFD